MFGRTYRVKCSVSLAAGFVAICSHYDCRLFPFRVLCAAQSNGVCKLSNEQYSFPTSVDSYNGVNINLAKLSSSAVQDSSDERLLNNAAVFRRCLRTSLQDWKASRYRAVWLRIPIEHSQLITEAVKEGFVFHHAEPDYLQLVNWLPSLDLTRDCGSTAEDLKLYTQGSVEYMNSTPLPANASHQVGVGCVVMHPDGRRLLVVQERRGPLRGKGVWKMPTGLIGAGEDISGGAEREVKEETGVDTKFKGVIAIRHSHGALHDKSDLFHICLLEARSDQITVQTDELAGAQWIDLESYLDQPRYAASPLYTMINEAIRAVVEGRSPPALTESRPLYGPAYRHKDKYCSLFHHSDLERIINEDKR